MGELVKGRYRDGDRSESRKIPNVLFYAQVSLI